MNPLKAYLQQRPDDESELHSTPNADDHRNAKRNLRWAGSVDSCSDSPVPKTFKLFHLIKIFVFVISDIDQSFNKVAERVLMRLQEKLKG